MELINQKEVVGDLFNQLRLALQRRTKGRPAQVSFQLSVDRLYRSFLFKNKNKFIVAFPLACYYTYFVAFCSLVT